MVCLVLLGCFVAWFALVQIRFVQERRRVSRLTWDGLVLQISVLNIAGLSEVAELYLHPDKEQLRVEPHRMWQVVGGLPGLEQMNNNARIMLDLAVYAERWNDENGRVLSEMMRRDAKRIQSAVVRIQLSTLTRIGMVGSPFYLQEAISSYCMMRGRLFGVYALGHAGLLPQLENAL